MTQMARRASAILIACMIPALSGCGLSQALRAEGDLPPGQSNAFSIAVGDCLNDTGQDDVLTVPVVDCTAPHDFEAVSTATMPDSDYPGEETIAAFATETCTAAVTDYVGAASDETRLSFTYFSPLESSWAGGDRAVLCLVGDPNGPVSESLEGKGPAYPTG